MHEYKQKELQQISLALLSARHKQFARWYCRQGDINFKLFYTVSFVSLHRYVTAWKKDQYLFDNVKERGPG
jgi:hypothetical protein